VFALKNSLVKIDATHFILAYRGSNGLDGFIKTFSIDGAYNITEIDTLLHDTFNNDYNSLVQIDPTHFMLAYAGDGGDEGLIRTFEVDGSYNVTETASIEHDTSTGIYNSLVKIDSTHFMLAYTGVDDDGFVKTFEFINSTFIPKIIIS